MQYLKLGNPDQALEEFKKLEAIARARGDGMLLAQALRNCGLALEAPPEPSYSNANIAYRAAIHAFPKDGRVYELAHIHELRANVNIKLPRLKQAHRSLMSALTAYSALEHQGNRDAAPAREGVKRVLEALKELRQLQSRLPAGNSVDDAADDENGASAPPEPEAGPSAQHQPAQQPPNGIRPN